MKNDRASFPSDAPPVGIVMGSRSDWDTMRNAAKVLAELLIPHEAFVVSAHRTPDRMMEYARTSLSRGLQIIIAGAGGAAHLPGMIASETSVPVIGVPVQSQALRGLDSLFSIVQMPAGVPVATMAIGNAGAKNAAVFAARILSLHDLKLAHRLAVFTENRARRVIEDADLTEELVDIQKSLLSE